MHTLTIEQIINLLKKKEISAIELVKYFLERIKKNNTNSIISLREKKSLEEAEKADINNKKKNYKGIPYGIPFLHKDTFCVKNEKTTSSSKMIKIFKPTYSATIHKKLINTGFILLGKTNMDEFCMGCSGVKTIFKPVKNPWNTKYSPGGSSSGSAASVASKLIPFSTGSDTGGSVRQPGAYCGITAIKPTYGRISRHGLISFASSLDHCGLLAKNAKDCALLLDIVSGFDKKDLTTLINKSTCFFLKNINLIKKNLTIGIPEEFFFIIKNTNICSKWNEIIKLLKSFKINISYIKLKKLYLYTTLYRIIASAECTSNLAKFDAIRFETLNSYLEKDFKNFYNSVRSFEFGKEVKKRLLLGTFLLTKYKQNTFYEEANTLRNMILLDYKTIFKKIDIILLPTTLSTAPKIKKNYNEFKQIHEDITTCISNLIGTPSITFPVGLSDEQLPIGMQLITNDLNEQLILNIVNLIQETTTWHLEINNIN